MILTVHGVLPAADAERIEAALAQAAFVDGKATATGAAAAAKNNRQAAATPAVRALQKEVLDALGRSDTFGAFAMPLRMMPLLFNRYEPGMAYGDHIDRPVMHAREPVRTDLAMTLFLSDPAGYDGGELVISSDLGAQRVKLPRGSLVLYPASTIHRVEPVTRGVRVAAVTWIQSMVREPERRLLLAELTGIKRWADQQGGSAQSLQLQKIRANLMRWWAEV
ncbi:MAG TPA: Fe2+-dependent dioxygenase [Candidatus Binatia bacterium]|nr:Fe2+-dependent dioxygenase [Candidatus Binatia bacterium]